MKPLNQTQLEILANFFEAVHDVAAESVILLDLDPVIRPVTLEEIENKYYAITQDMEQIRQRLTDIRRINNEAQEATLDPDSTRSEGYE